MGSAFLRSPGSSKPVQYDFRGVARSACPAVCAKAIEISRKAFLLGVWRYRVGAHEQQLTRGITRSPDFFRSQVFTTQ